MPQQLITGTDCCPCSCPDTCSVTIVNNVVADRIGAGPPSIEATDVEGRHYTDYTTSGEWYFHNGAWVPQIF